MKVKYLLLYVLLLFTYIAVYANKGKNNDLENKIKLIDVQAYRLAIKDMKLNYPDKIKNANKYLNTLEKFEKNKKALLKGIRSDNKKSIRRAQKLLKTLSEGLLQNPILDFDKIVILRRALNKRARKAKGGGLGIAPNNFNNNSSIHNPNGGWKNDVVLLENLKKKIKTTTIFKPKENTIINDLNLDFDNSRLMYSSIGTNDRWHIFTYNFSDKSTKQITPEYITDYDCFDGTFLPDGNIIYCSTATFLGLPCINGRPRMCGLYKIDTKSGKIRQLTFDQDSNWEPVVLSNGKILYQCWEYSGLPHSNSRIMFTMNPDGTSQKAFYGSNSYFPTSFFGSRPLPGSSSSIVGIATGHHSVSRNGRLMIIDIQKGRKEADGVVTEIPHRGKKVMPKVRDRLSDGVWPMFMNPYPLNDKYFLVSMKPHKNALWGLYLVDVFNNMTLIYENEGDAVIEALPMNSVKKPHIIPNKVDLKSETATVYIQDIYHGPGLKGIPRGEVKSLRIGSYYFSPYAQGGLLGTIGMDGPWDINRIIGTVPVEDDGSVMFEIPANTPIFLQPLDKEGMTLQHMRSWFTGMPGEKVSCIGCHENQNDVAIPKYTKASRMKPVKIKPWQGKERSFSFKHEIQPILDKLCISCHNENNSSIPYLKGDKMLTDWDSQMGGKAGAHYGGHFSESYAQLHRYVRRPGIESDMDIFTPMDFHESQTELIQILKKGHHNVKLTQEEYEKLYCWIAFNAPYHGQRSDIPNYHEAKPFVKRMKENSLKYANKKLTFDNLGNFIEKPSPVKPDKYPELSPDDTAPEGWPLELKKAHKKQISQGFIQFDIDLGKGIYLSMTKIPAGEFLMGSKKQRDEQPLNKVKIEKPFWMGKFEITNEQYALFDSEHNSRTEHRHGYQFGQKGYPLNKPTQPVVRVSLNEALKFCKCLSKKTGYKFNIPTEAQWEWACRAGTETDFWFGNIGSDYSNYANMGDKKLAEFAACTSHKFYESTRILDNPNRYDDWIPRDTIYNDGGFVSDHVGRYRQNPWELFDIHGNVWEWTRSEYKPYPYKESNDLKFSNDSKYVVRGGSWYSRPHRNTSSYRLPYKCYQKVFDVGFRVIIE